MIISDSEIPLGVDKVGSPGDAGGSRDITDNTSAQQAVAQQMRSAGSNENDATERHSSDRNGEHNRDKSNEVREQDLQKLAEQILEKGNIPEQLKKL